MNYYAQVYLPTEGETFKWKNICEDLSTNMWRIAETRCKSKEEAEQRVENYKKNLNELVESRVIEFDPTKLYDS